MKDLIFSPADILLPKDKENFTKWAVIACDQFTSEGEYWQKVREITNGSPSAHNLVLPEAYLGSEREASHKALIESEMQKVGENTTLFENSLVYVCRTLPDGKVRHGIVGKIDLECYEYTKKSNSAVRATEATVLERIPPRCKIRESVTYELPHVMLFMDDREKEVFPKLESMKDNLTKLYDFELMLGGGSIQGYRIDGEELSSIMGSMQAYERSRKGGIVYAVGDGNHSLAAAKAHFENVKKNLGEKAMTHPARYALVEVVDLNDNAIEFEPIYRIVKGVDETDLVNALKGDGEQKVTVVVGDKKSEISLNNTHSLTVGSLQNAIDEYTKTHDGAECDYIHDEQSLLNLCKEKNTVGFLFEGMEKQTLFSYAENFGTLPRKTFSMGEARSKRYYIETRKIR